MSVVVRKSRKNRTKKGVKAADKTADEKFVEKVNSYNIYHGQDPKVNFSTEVNFLVEAFEAIRRLRRELRCTAGATLVSVKAGKDKDGNPVWEEALNGMSVGAAELLFGERDYISRLRELKQFFAYSRKRAPTKKIPSKDLTIANLGAANLSPVITGDALTYWFNTEDFGNITGPNGQPVPLQQATPFLVRGLTLRGNVTSLFYLVLNLKGLNLSKNNGGRSHQSFRITDAMKTAFGGKPALYAHAAPAKAGDKPLKVANSANASTFQILDAENEVKRQSELAEMKRLEADGFAKDSKEYKLALRAYNSAYDTKQGIANNTAVESIKSLNIYASEAVAGVTPPAQSAAAIAYTGTGKDKKYNQPALIQDLLNEYKLIASVKDHTEQLSKPAKAAEVAARPKK